VALSSAPFGALLLLKAEVPIDMPSHAESILVVSGGWAASVSSVMCEELPDKAPS
jgi:hypothetical protein